MSAPPSGGGTPIENRRQLIEYFAAGNKPPTAWRMGTEHEKFGFHTATLKPLAYDGPDGIRAMLEGMTRFGWEPVVEGNNPIALQRANASITLEPGGQFELSGAPLETLHETAEENDQHLDEVKEVAGEIGAGFIGLGFAPEWRREDMHWMPKGRYKIMREYMPKKGKLGIDMMLRTCTVQTNLDFESEADMVKKFRVVARPAAAGHRAVRQLAFQGGQGGGLQELSQPHLDRHRSRPLRHAALRVRGRFRLRALCRLHARRADVLRLSRRQVHRRLGPELQGFPQGQAAGAAGRAADDQRLGRPHHDGVPRSAAEALPRDARRRFGAVPALNALPALWVGLLYDRTALDAAWDLVKDWTAADHDFLRAETPRTGLSTIFRGPA